MPLELYFLFLLMYQEAEKTKKFYEWFREKQETGYSKTEDVMFLAFQAGFKIGHEAGERKSRELVNYLTAPKIPSFKKD